MKKIVILILCVCLLAACGKKEVTPIDVPETVDAPVIEQPDAPPVENVDIPVSNKSAPTEPETQSVSITVYGLESSVVFSGATEYYKGITAFDVLITGAKERNIPVVYSGSKSAAYITSIGGLAEKQHGGQSGWIFTVNGESVMKPSGKCILNPGDNVEWKYITEFQA